MPVTLTKSELNKILVAERAKQNARNKQSKFMNSTRGKYTGQENRLREKTGKPKAKLPYTLEEFREFVQQALGTPCPYSGAKLSLANYTADHRDPIAVGGGWGLDNMIICTCSANWQKGATREAVFLRLMKGARKIMNDYEFDNFKRRLSMGGKWLNQGGK